MKPNPIGKRCIVRKWETRELPLEEGQAYKRRESVKVFDCEGTFMSFGVSSVENEFGFGNYSTGVVLTDDGQFHNEPIEMIEITRKLLEE